MSVRSSDGYDIYALLTLLSDRMFFTNSSMLKILKLSKFSRIRDARRESTR